MDLITAAVTLAHLLRVSTEPVLTDTYLLDSLAKRICFLLYLNVS